VREALRDNVTSIHESIRSGENGKTRIATVNESGPEIVVGLLKVGRRCGKDGGGRWRRRMKRRRTKRYASDGNLMNKNAAMRSKPRDDRRRNEKEWITRSRWCCGEETRGKGKKSRLRIHD